jgi:hypothetical protein
VTVLCISSWATTLGRPYGPEFANGINVTSHLWLALPCNTL